MRVRGRYVLIILLVGAILGSIIGYVLRELLPILDMGVKIGLSPVTVDLYLFDLTFGIHLKITLASIMGLLATFLLLDIR